MRRAAAGFVVALLPVLATQAAPPLPEPNFAGTVLPAKCAAEDGNQYEAAAYQQEGWSGPQQERYPGACQRLHFTFGPLHIRPGQNDVVIQPVTVEKPAYDGYVVRFRPNLVRADGSIPPIEELHLHHAVWFSVAGQSGGRGSLGPLDFTDYGNGPFFASGEEKTIFNMPRGYGFPMKGTDQWQILYMIHNFRAQPDNVWITYDIDYVAKDIAEQQLKLKPVYPVWLDVKPSYYPVFNVQRGYGHRDPATHRFVCTYPKEKTAAFDPWGRTAVAQGQPGNGLGKGLTLPPRGASIGRIENFTGGTLIAIGGHLHPGGLSVDIDLERQGQRQRIFTSEARYWDWNDPSKEGGPPTSWDLSIATSGLPRWGVHVEPSDSIWLNATYDAEIQSTYENMGISIAWLAPDTPAGPSAPGLNPFTATPDASPGCDSGGLAAGALCDKGRVTHGHMREADHKGGPSGSLPTRPGAPASRVDIAAFSYQPGDQGSASSSGLLTVPLGGSLTFVNDDAVANIYHSVTSCAYPCTGATGIAFPLADGSSSDGSRVDFDSGQLGYEATAYVGAQLGPAKGTNTWNLPVSADSGFHTGAVYTFFCRVHPFMRGAFAVQGTAPTGPAARAPIAPRGSRQPSLGLADVSSANAGAAPAWSDPPPVPEVMAGPGSYLTTYATPVMASQEGQPLWFVNNDMPTHNVTADDLDYDGLPLFRSKDIGSGEQGLISGVERLRPGQTYAFHCTIHSNMKGTLVIAGAY